MSSRQNNPFVIMKWLCILDNILCSEIILYNTKIAILAIFGSLISVNFVYPFPLFYF